MIDTVGLILVVRLQERCSALSSKSTRTSFDVAAAFSSSTPNAFLSESVDDASRPSLARSEAKMKLLH